MTSVDIAAYNLLAVLLSWGKEQVLLDLTYDYVGYTDQRSSV